MTSSGSATSASRSVATRAAVGVACLLAGLLCLGLWRVLSGTENLVFASGAANPPAAHVTQGEQYSLAVPGGARALVAAGVYGAPGQNLDLQCQWRTGATGEQALTVTAEQADTKAETTVASFAAPVTGDIRVTCANWGEMFVPDADNVAPDRSGLVLLLSCLLLLVGSGLTLSAARERSLRRNRTGEDDEVERRVDGQGALAGDHEVVRADGGDICA